MSRKKEENKKEKMKGSVVVFQMFLRLKVKVKVTLVQALRLCTGRTAHRGSRGIALPSGVTRNFVRVGGVQKIQLRTEDR